jgi:thioredoxin reductase
MTAHDSTLTTALTSSTTGPSAAGSSANGDTTPGTGANTRLTPSYRSAAPSDPRAAVALRPSHWPLPDAATYDVVVIGGGAAGLSAALVLGRSRRRALVIDAGEPRNAGAAHMHGYLTRDGMNPGAFLDLGRGEVRAYGGEIVRGTVRSIERQGGGFITMMADGRTVQSRRLLVTTGLVDMLPAISGLRERWGRDVLHCPYCHGYEVRDQPLGMIAPSLFRVQHAMLIRHWSADVTVFPHTLAPVEIPAATREQLAAVGVRLVEGKVAGVVVEADHLTGVRMESGEVVPVQAVFAGVGFEARDPLLLALGAATTDTPMGTYVTTDPFGLTSLPGVWAAGNVTSPAVQVIDAASAGARAAMSINLDLVHEDTERAVHALRAQDRQLAAG